MAVKFSNNAKTTLASAVGSSDTSISVSDASTFPTLAAGDHTYLTIVRQASLTTLEIVKVTAISGTTLTVVRAQQGTSAISFSAADLCELRVTSGLVQDALDEKVDDSQVLTDVPSGALFTDTNTTYSVGDGGLSQKNFTTTLKTKLDGIATGANNYNLPFTDNSSNWDTAYGWGDHSTEGYLTSYTDTNTTYSAGTGVTLTGTTFSLTDTNAKLNLTGGTLTGAVTAPSMSLSGNLTLSGTVDGRDVAADGTKLDGIEAGATADQTKAELSTLGMISNDTSQPHSFTIRNGSPTINFRDTDHRGFHLHCNSNLLYMLNSNAVDGIAWTTVNGHWAFHINSTNNAANFGGSITAVGNITAYSDERIKDNIETIDNALEKVTKMRGIYYNRNDLGEEENAVRRTGVVAQEIEKVLPEVVRENEEKDLDDSGKTLEGGRKRLTVDYGNMVGVLIEAIKEQQEQIDSVKQILDELKNGTSE